MAWWNNDWNYKKKVTLATSTYLAGDVTNDHVILVQQTAGDTADFWANSNADGSDVRFVNAAEDTELKFYFQRWDDGNELMDARVRVTDTFPSASDLDIYMYYGNVGAADGQDSANTLSDFVSMHHCDDNAGTTVTDKVGAFNLTATNAAIWDSGNAKVGLSALGHDQSYYATSGTLLDTSPNNGSFEFWTKLVDDTYAGSRYFFFKKPIADPRERIMVIVVPSSGLVHFYKEVGGSTVTCDAGNVITDKTAWYHMVASYGSNGMVVFANGVSEGTNASTTSLGDGTAADFYLGTHEAGGGYTYQGIIDEFAIRSVQLTVNEAMLLYRSSNSDLQSYSAEEAKPVVGQFMTPKKYW